MKLTLLSLILLLANTVFAFEKPAFRPLTLGNSAGDARLSCAAGLPEHLQFWMGPETHAIWQIDFASADNQTQDMFLTLSKNGSAMCKFKVAYDSHLNWHGSFTDPILRVDNKMELTSNPVCAVEIGKELDLNGVVGQSLKLNINILRICSEQKPAVLKWAGAPFRFYKITDSMHCRWADTFDCAPVFAESQEP